MRRPFYTLLLVAAVSWLSACDTTVDRFSEGESDFVYNIVGFLQTETDTQFVRVQGIRPSVDPVPVESLEARVSLIDRTTGEEIIMRDSLIQLDSGNAGHLFFAVMPVTAGRTYEIRAEDGLGRATVASTLVPEKPPFSFLPPNTVGAVTTQLVSWEGIVRTPDNAEVIYKIARDGTQPPTLAAVPYTLRGRLVQEAWSADVRLSEDLQILRQQVGIPPDATDAVFSGMAMTIRIPSVEWANAPNGENIEHGTGFFGSIGNFTEEWLLSSDVIEALGFVNGQQP